MGKVKNIKRAKMLRERKKERENEKLSSPDNNTHELSKIKKRLDKELNADVKLNSKSNSNERKISDVVSEMIQPLMKEARTIKEEQNIIGIGVMAWNLGVIKKNNGEEAMQKALKGFGMILQEEFINIVLDYSKIKCENYGEYNALIVDYKFTRLNSHQNNLTVSYETIKE